jgi:hypothetical protein
VNFDHVADIANISWPAALAQHEGDHRREADQADHGHYNEQHSPPSRMPPASPRALVRAALLSLRSELERMISDCSCGRVAECRVIEVLASNIATGTR